MFGYKSFLTASTFKTIIVPRVLFSTSFPIMYREDYNRLGIPTNSTKEEIKTAYYEKAKLLHPDLGNPGDNSQEFLNLNESYRRLTFDNKSSLDDPRNDPHFHEYWTLRYRTKSEEEKRLDQELDKKHSLYDMKMIRQIAIALLFAIFFGKIFPALFLFQDEQNCNCTRCTKNKQEQDVQNLRTLGASSK